MPATSDVLSIFAEIAIGLAGFSAIIVAFNREIFSELEIVERIKGLIVVSLILLLGSVLPLVGLLYRQFSDVAWQLASGILLFALITDVVLTMYRSAGINIDIWRSLASVGALAVFYSPIVANIFGVFDSAEFGYLASLCVPLILSCLIFYELVAIMLRRDA